MTHAVIVPARPEKANGKLVKAELTGERKICLEVSIQSPVGADAYIGPTFRFLSANEGGCGHPPLRSRARLNKYVWKNGNIPRRSWRPTD